MGKLEGMIKSEIVRLAKRECEELLFLGQGCPFIEEHRVAASKGSLSH